MHRQPHPTPAQLAQPAKRPSVGQLRLTSAPHCVRSDGTAVALAVRDAALLAWLALEGPTPRARLGALLWPDSEAAAARNALRQRLFMLRKSLGFDAVVGSVTLALTTGLTHDLDDADSVLGDAAPAAAGEFAAWLEQQRSRRRGRLQQSLTELAQMAEDARDWPDALGHAREALALEPLSEAAHRRVIRLHYLAGDRAAALLAFDHCEQVLKDEVGAAPSAETLALLATVDRGAASGALSVGNAVPASVLRPPRMIGREQELAQLVQGFAGGLVVAVIGEAGLGKTRLLQECAQAQAGLVHVSARPGDAGVPYASLARLLRAVTALAPSPPVLEDGTRREIARVLPEFDTAAPRIGGEGQRLVLQRAVQALLASQRNLTGLMVDDLHFADPASLDMLLTLIDATGSSDGQREAGLTAAPPLRWALAYRPAEAGSPLHGLHDALVEQVRLQPLGLAPLDEVALAALVDSLCLPGVDGRTLAPGLRQRTGGNPLFVLETLKQAWVEHTLDRLADAQQLPRPLSVGRLIQRRVGQLSPPALALARVASIAGLDFEIALAEQVLGVSAMQFADALNELEAAQVLRGDAFAHDLVFEAVLASVPTTIAARTHGQVAAWLEARAGEPARIAAHWLAAGEPHKAVPHLTRSAQRAHAAWQRGVAAELHEQAATILLAAGDRRGAFDAYFAAAEAASQMAGRGRLPAYGQALGELADDDGQRAAAALVPTYLLTESRQIEAARQLALAALPQAQRAGLADIEVELLWFLALLHHDQRQLAEATQCIEQALARLAAVDPATARLKHLGTRFKLTSGLGLILSSTGQYAQGNKYLAQALQQARDGREWAYTSGVAKDLANNSVEQGQIEGALVWSAQSIADDERFDGGEHGRAVAASHRGVVLALGGNLGGALASAEHAVAICERVALRVELSVRQRLHALQFELGRRDLALKGLQALRARADLQAIERIALDAELLRVGASVDSAALLEQVVALDDLPLRARLLCLAQPGCDPVHILPLLAWSAAAARDHGAYGMWLTLQTRRVAALRMAGRASEATEQALAVWQRVEEGISGIELFPRMAADLCAALADSHTDLMQVMALRAGAWMQLAAASLPAEWRQNYLMRAPTLQNAPTRVRGLMMTAGPAPEPESAAFLPASQRSHPGAR